MDDLRHASTFLLIFGVALAAYAFAIARTGDKSLLPLRAQHSIRNSDDVRRVGRITLVVAAVICAAMLLVRLVLTFGS
jgi:hypothetical protein